MMHANNREDVKIARTGDIIAVAGLKDVITGETLCDEKAPIILERMEFPGGQPLNSFAHAGRLLFAASNHSSLHLSRLSLHPELMTLACMHACMWM